MLNTWYLVIVNKFQNKNRPEITVIWLCAGLNAGRCSSSRLKFRGYKNTCPAGFKPTTTRQTRLGNAYYKSGLSVRSIIETEMHFPFFPFYPSQVVTVTPSFPVQARVCVQNHVWIKNKYKQFIASPGRTIYIDVSEGLDIADEKCWHFVEINTDVQSELLGFRCKVLMYRIVYLSL